MKININEGNENINQVSNNNKSSQIICPKCSENCKISIKNFKIKLYGCSNKHCTKNILLEDFENTQNIDKSNIKCSSCKISYKDNSEENNIYLCCNCKKNFCNKCKIEHNKSHELINYKEKHYICQKHYRYYDSYCKSCKQNIINLN